MPDPRHRRDFLKPSACALSLPVVSSGFATEPSANTSGEKLKIGVIGVGNRGASNLAEVLTEEIVALCDVDARYLNEMATRHPAAKTYVDFRELLDHPDLDAWPADRIAGPIAKRSPIASPRMAYGL